MQNSLDYCQVGDVFRFRNRLQRAVKTKDKDKQRSLLKSLEKDIDKSIVACNQRADALPKSLHYPEQLPFSAKAEEIGKLIASNQVLVVAGDTGSGKTTQLPKICVQAGFGKRGLIGHTQPRRLAAVSVASRIAEEMSVKLGEGVGFQIRFNENVTSRTFLKIMTDGILLAEIQQDRFLNRYEVIIIDEAHERSLNIDFLLGYMKYLLAKRKDLKLIITSATIDVEKFSKHFDNAPVVAVSGRTYPVEVRYAPPEALSDGGDGVEVQASAIVEAVEEIQAEDRRASMSSGDILVFLSTERDIRETAQALRKQKFRDTEILPLYARLKQSEQKRIFQSHKGRRIVLSTNVAETSITVPGINYVIDTGVARISRYSLQNKVQRLPIEAISQASANQRKGRCGRVADGICIRLYSEQEFESRAAYTDPEILRTNLASVILRMQHLRLGDVANFPFLEAPAPKAINEGFKLLIELNALNPDRTLTAVGRKMATLPVDPKYARMLITADSERCLTELLVIVSALSIQDPRETGVENRQQAREKHEQFVHPESDFLELVNLWNVYERKRQSLGQNQLRKYCKQQFLSFMRMREWREVHRQLLLASQQLGLRVNREPASYSAVHKAIISGSLNQIAMRSEGKFYQGSRNKRFSLFPSSSLVNKQVKWIVTGNQIETSQTFATSAARIQPEWVEEKALHLVKREYFEPHWSQKQQQVMAYEKVSLYGLTLIEKKQVPYAAIDKEKAREIFIREALVTGNLDAHSELLAQNRQFLQELERQEEKIRRPDFLVSDSDVARFYEERVPSEVSSTQDFNNWLSSASGASKNALRMDEDNLLKEDSLDSFTSAYPDQAALQHNKLDIHYSFEPGKSRDGATIEVPLSILRQITQADIDWAVPGIIREKCIALVKSLPKSQRKNFIPVSGFVDEVIEQMVPGEATILQALRSQIRRTKKIDVPASQFNEKSLPTYLKNKICVVDSAGVELATGSDLDTLRESLDETWDESPRHSEEPSGGMHELERSGLKDWDLDLIPEQVKLGDDLVLVRYPALVDETDSASIRLYADPAEAEEQHRRGLLRLYILRSNQQRKMLLKQFGQFVRANPLLVPPMEPACEEQAAIACYGAAFAIDTKPVRMREQFEQNLQSGKQSLFSFAAELERLLEMVFKSRRDLLLRLEKGRPGDPEYLLTDLRGQIDTLFAADFLISTPWPWLSQFSRYLQAAEMRLNKSPHLGSRDAEFTEEISKYWRKYLDLCDQRHTENKGEIDLFRWMIEEYRVSLFAQSLGTSLPVSRKRLDKQLELIT